MKLKEFIRNISDFPEEGIEFKDITPLLQNSEAFDKAIDNIYRHYQDFNFDYIAGIEARGFIIGPPLALKFNKGFIPIRKPGKLPADKLSTSYDLEYGSNELEIHQDAINPGDKILLVDDLLATGGTVKAAIDLIEELGGEVVSVGFLLELEKLNGRQKFNNYDSFSLIKD